VLLRQRVGERLRIGGERREVVGAVVDPFGVAVSALIDRVGGAAEPDDDLRGLAPGVTGLAAAVQQQHRRTLAAVAIDVALEAIAGRAGEGRGDGLDLPLAIDLKAHVRSPRNCSAPALNTLSPTASI
jgi:hypothetical protein